MRCFDLGGINGKTYEFDRLSVARVFKHRACFHDVLRGAYRGIGRGYGRRGFAERNRQRQ